MNIKRIVSIIAVLMLAGCSLTDEGMSTTAANYVRLTEYGASVPLYGGVSGCQVSSEGKIEGSVSLSTENCNVSISE